MAPPERCVGSCRSIATPRRAHGPDRSLWRRSTPGSTGCRTLTESSHGRDLRYREVTDFGSLPMSPVMAGAVAIGLGGVEANPDDEPSWSVRPVSATVLHG
jgi:hypothetical protein